MESADYSAQKAEDLSDTSAFGIGKLLCVFRVNNYSHKNIHL
jgi:hypothetical protein